MKKFEQKMKDWAEQNLKWRKYRDNEKLLFHIYKKFHSKIEQCRIGGQEVIIDWDDRLLYFNLRKELMFLRTDKKFDWGYRWYFGLNYDILEFSINHGLIIHVQSIKGPVYIVYQTVQFEAVEKNWVIRTAKSGLKIYAIPTLKTPLFSQRKKTKVEGQDHKITEFAEA